MHVLAQFIKKYTGNEQDEVSIEKLKRQVSLLLCVYAVVILTFRFFVYKFRGYGDVFVGDLIPTQYLQSNGIMMVFYYAIPFFIWVYSIKASCSEAFLLKYTSFERVNILLSLFPMGFIWGIKGVILGVCFFIMITLVRQKIESINQLRASKTTETETQATLTLNEDESAVLRQSANNMLLVYGIAALYPRFMGSFMRIGLWDFIFSAAPISLWSIVLYSLLPFAMYLYSVKIKRTSKVMLGYCFWLGIYTGLALVLSVLGFFGAILGEAGEYPSSNPYIIKILAIAINSFFYFFVSGMYEKYRKSYRLQEGADGILKKNIFSIWFVFFIFLLSILLPLSFLYIKELFSEITQPIRYRGYKPDYSGEIVVAMMIIGVALAIIYKLLKEIREPLLFIVRGAWGRIKTIFVPENDGKTADDVREVRKELYVATAMVFLLIMGHLIYAAQGFSLIPLM